MVSRKNVKVSQKRCLGTSIESFTGSSPSEQIIEIRVRQAATRNFGGRILLRNCGPISRKKRMNFSIFDKI